jgi:hypothetical protein
MDDSKSDGGERGIRTPDRGVSPYNGLANRRLQPLGHLSVYALTDYIGRALKFAELNRGASWAATLHLSTYLERPASQAAAFQEMREI